MQAPHLGEARQEVLQQLLAQEVHRGTRTQLFPILSYPFWNEMSCSARATCLQGWTHSFFRFFLGCPSSSPSPAPATFTGSSPSGAAELSCSSLQKGKRSLKCRGWQADNPYFEGLLSFLLMLFKASFFEGSLPYFLRLSEAFSCQVIHLSSVFKRILSVF